MQKPEPRQPVAPGESKLHFLDYWRVIRVRFGIVLLSFMLVVITAGVTTYFQPRKYRASVTLELRLANNKYNPFKPDQSDGMGGTDARFVPTQTEILKSREVLNPVVDSQDLQRKWSNDGAPISKESAYYRLASMVLLKSVRGTDMMELSVASTIPDESKHLVDAVAESYQSVRQANDSRVTNQGYTTVQGDIEAGRQKVESLRLKLAKYRTDHPGMIDPDPDGQTKHQDPYENEVSARQGEVDHYTTTVAGLTSQLNKIGELKGEELMRALAVLQISDPTVQSILPKYQEAVSGEAQMLNMGLGPNHPKLVSLRATRNVYTKQLTDQVESIRHSLSIQLDVAKSTLASVTKQLDDLRATQRKQRADNAEYDNIKEEYIKAKDLQQVIEVKSEQTRLETGITTIPAFIWNVADMPTSPFSPNVTLNMAIGVLIGLIVGVGLAFFIEYLDTSVKTMDDVETMLGVPVLAIVPKNIKLLHKQAGDVPDAEAYRILRTNIEFNRKSADANTISMVSGGPGEGKSTTLCNLAFTCAQGGYSVLIVDADLRRPTQHKIFEINNSVGLTNYLTTNIALEKVIVQTPVENLSLMPSGILPADAVGILNSQRMSDMIAELKTRYDIIFFDSPPILGVSDGAVLASEVDQSIIIVQHRRFPRAMLMRVKQAINNVGGTVLGVVLNNVDLRHDPNYAYYTSYYEYYAVHTPRDVVPTPNASAPASGGGKQAVVSTTARGGTSNGNSGEY